MRIKGFNRLSAIMGFAVISIFLMTGCHKEADKSKTVILEAVEAEEPIKQSVTEEQLDIILKKLQGDMRVFDVVEYHDELYAMIKAEVNGSESDENLNAKIAPIVENYIQEILSDKIRASLGDNYTEADFEWLYTHVETTSLQKLIVAYEREYIKHTTK